MIGEFTQQVQNFQRQPQSEGIQICIPTLMEEPPPFQGK